MMLMRQNLRDEKVRGFPDSGFLQNMARITLVIKDNHLSYRPGKFRRLPFTTLPADTIHTGA